MFWIRFRKCIHLGKSKCNPIIWFDVLIPVLIGCTNNGICTKYTHYVIHCYFISFYLIKMNLSKDRLESVYKLVLFWFYNMIHLFSFLSISLSPILFFHRYFFSLNNETFSNAITFCSHSKWHSVSCKMKNELRTNFIQLLFDWHQMPMGTLNNHKNGINIKWDKHEQIKLKMWWE